MPGDESQDSCNILYHNLWSQRLDISSWYYLNVNARCDDSDYDYDDYDDDDDDFFHLKRRVA